MAIWAYYAPVKNAIVVICYSRPDLLENCLLSLLAAESNEDFTKILVQQVGFASVDRVVEKYSSNFDLIVKVKRSGDPTQNISNNRYLAYTIGFDHFSAEYVIVLEDDVEIAPDALIFADELFKKYKNRKDFRAVNFGSGIEFSEENRFTYSRVRYALHGPASMIPRATWKTISNQGMERLLSKGIFDGVIECLIQRGFVIMPNVSRYKDFGFIGTHSVGTNPTTYFDKLMKSSAPTPTANHQPLIERYLPQNWRKDCVRFRRRDNFYYQIRSLIIFNNDIHPFMDVWRSYFFLKRLTTRLKNRIG